MKHIVLILTGLLFVSLQSFAQVYPKARYLNVQSDKNIRKNTDPKLCMSCSDNNFVVDGNESYGVVELDFNEVSNYGPPRNAELIVNISTVEYAESNDGFGVFINDKKIGIINKVERNSCEVVKLDVSHMATHKSIKLTLKANGDDGLYILSKASGFGAVLKLQY